MSNVFSISPKKTKLTGKSALAAISSLSDTDEERSESEPEEPVKKPTRKAARNRKITIDLDSQDSDEEIAKITRSRRSSTRSSTKNSSRQSSRASSRLSGLIEPVEKIEDSPAKKRLSKMLDIDMVSSTPSGGRRSTRNGILIKKYKIIINKSDFYRFINL